MSYIFLFCLILYSATSCLFAGEPLDFKLKSNWSGVPIPTADGFRVIRMLGSANFMEKYPYPLQMVYDTSVTESGLLGTGWRIPQLESSVKQTGGKIIWHTPWEKTIEFPDSNQLEWVLTKTDRDIFQISGTKQHEGWHFHYRKHLLKEIIAPGDNSLRFEYHKNLPVRVKTQDKVLITAEYVNNRLVRIKINQVNYYFKYDRNNRLKSYRPELLPPIQLHYD